jgi:NAD(P)-dependent dehydrogenase (short-subunit alcohol dehydrogenase family)
MMLENQIAIIYGAAGGIGSAVARAFAAEGARVFVTGHRKAPVQALAKEIGAEAAEVDALDEAQIERHLAAVVQTAGRVDISFNAVGIPDRGITGVPLVELDAAQFALPISAYTTSYFLTARLAARHMIPRKSGVIMTVSALPARMGTTLNGGYGPALAAKEAMTRDLSTELAPHGIRVVALRPHGLPETQTMRDLHEIKTPKLTYEQFQGYLAGMSHAKRVMNLAEVANVAAFVASPKASALFASTIDLTMGSIQG